MFVPGILSFLQFRIMLKGEVFKIIGEFSFPFADIYSINYFCRTEIRRFRFHFAVSGSCRNMDIGKHQKQIKPRKIHFCFRKNRIFSGNGNRLILNKKWTVTPNQIFRAILNSDLLQTLHLKLLKTMRHRSNLLKAPISKE